MHQGADLDDGSFKYPMGGGVGDHQGGQVVGVQSRLGCQVGQIDIALVIAGHRHHLQAGHHGAGGVGAVGAGGNQAHPAMALAAAFVVSTNHQQAGIFTLGTGIGLQRYAGKAGDRRQPVF